MKETLGALPTRKVNKNGQVVNKVYGDKDARISMNNYVWYSGQLWQVLEVNDDNIKMVTAMPVTSITYGQTSDWNTSWVKKWLNEEFLSVLTRKDLILDTNFCLDRVSASYGDDFVADGKTIKTVTGHAKINSCIDQVSEKVGLLTFEDYVYAYDAINPTYMIANFISGEELEWIMTAYDSDQMWVTWYNKKYEYITISENDYSYVKGYGHGVRPVISIKSSVLVDYGVGSNDEPYVLISEQKVDNGGKTSDVKVGDYVYIDESNNPYPYTTDRVTSDITYKGTKDMVRYRVVRKIMMVL